MIEYAYRVPDEELPAPLPTLAEIDQGTAIPSVSPMLPSRARRVGPHFIVKCGTIVDVMEVKNMLFVRKHSDLVVPKPYAAYTDTDTGRKYIVMEYIPGRTFKDGWGSLDEATRDLVLCQLRRGFDQLRSAPSPGHFARPNGEQWMNVWLPLTEDDMDFFKDNHRPGSGYEWVETTVKGLRARLPTLMTPDQYEVFRKLFHAVLDHLSDPSDVVFTHGDLHRSNLYIRESDNTPVVLDWEAAGFCPPYMDYLVFMNFEALSNFGFIGYIDRILDPYPNLAFLGLFVRFWQTGFF